MNYLPPVPMTMAEQYANIQYAKIVNEMIGKATKSADHFYYCGHCKAVEKKALGFHVHQHDGNGYVLENIMAWQADKLRDEANSAVKEPNSRYFKTVPWTRK